MVDGQSRLSGLKGPFSCYLFLWLYNLKTSNFIEHFWHVIDRWLKSSFTLIKNSGSFWFFRSWTSWIRWVITSLLISNSWIFFKTFERFMFFSVITVSKICFSCLVNSILISWNKSEICFLKIALSFCKIKKKFNSQVGTK